MANFNLNKAILGGRLTTDPELKQTQSGVAVCSFVIAVNRKFKGSDGQQQADFLNITAWREAAEFVSRYFRKGSSICVIGSIQNRTWTDPQGVKHYATDIVADEVTFVDSKQQDAPTVPAEAAQKPEKQSYSTGGGAPELRELKTDDDLPF